MAFGRRVDEPDDVIRSVPPPPPSGEGASVLGPNVHIEGTLIGLGSVRIDGEFKGKIVHDGHLTLGETAVVNATVHASELVIMGRLEGSVETSGLLELRPSARLVGSIKAPRVVMSDGASVVGDWEVTASASG